MTAKEFISHLSPVDLERMALIFRYLGDHMGELRLSNDSRLCDATDFAVFMYELAAAAAVEQLRVSGAVFLSKVCPTCGHPHHSGEECGMDMGGAGKCGCKAEVPA